MWDLFLSSLPSLFFFLSPLPVPGPAVEGRRNRAGQPRKGEKPSKQGELHPHRYPPPPFPPSPLSHPQTKTLPGIHINHSLNSINLYPPTPNNLMDQKIQGRTATPPPLLSGAPTGEREKEGAGGKKEEEEEKKRDREKEGTPTASAGAGGTGGPGGAGGDQSHFSIKESSLSEGNVKLKIGLQAKRMKKPPKILENYVCRPAFRATVRHTGRGGGNARGNRAGATGDGAGSQSQSPSQGREKEREKSPSVNRPPISSSSTAPTAKAPTPPPLAPPPASTTTLTPSQMNGNAPAKKVWRLDAVDFIYFGSAVIFHFEQN